MESTTCSPFTLDETNNTCKSEFPLQDMEKIITSFDKLNITVKSNISIDDFDLVKIIGTGSYGKVILSKKRDSGEIYAIKVLKKK